MSLVGQFCIAGDIWKITEYTYVIGDNKMQLKPGYIISATTYTNNFSISHESIEDGLKIKKLFKS